MNYWFFFIKIQLMSDGDGGVQQTVNVKVCVYTYVHTGVYGRNLKIQCARGNTSK